MVVTVIGGVARAALRFPSSCVFTTSRSSISELGVCVEKLHGAARPLTDEAKTWSLTERDLDRQSNTHRESESLPA